MNIRLSAFLKSAADIIFPQHLKCHCCDREADVNFFGICGECEDELRFAPNLPRIEGIDGFQSALIYNEPARNALVSFKFNGAVYKKEFLSHFMSVPAEWRVDCIVPVPLSEERFKERGYNQSTVLAEEVAKRSGLTVREDLLKRRRETEKQSMMTREQRQRNLKGAFSASKECKGLSILLIDDIKTTGATLRECAKELKKRGASAVYALTACCAAEEMTGDG